MGKISVNDKVSMTNLGKIIYEFRLSRSMQKMGGH